MKKVIIATLVAGFISLGFSVVKTPAKNKLSSKAQILTKAHFSKADVKRLASWD